MTRFFDHEAAWVASEDMKIRFPQLHNVRVLDVRNQENGEYERSFVSCCYGDILADRFIGHNFNSQRDVEMFLELCQYIASAMSDNQQSKEEDSKGWNIGRRDGKWNLPDDLTWKEIQAMKNQNFS